MEKLSWVEVGAEVVMYSCARGMPAAHRTTVARVNKVSFSVTDSARLFRLDDGYSKGGDSWSAGYRVVPFDSDEGQRALEKVEHWKQRERVRHRYARWNENPTFENRQALIDVLNAVESDEVES